MSEIIEEIRNYLESRTGRQDLRTMELNESLLETGIIDSMVMVGLTAFIEEKYGFRVDEDDMVPENFETLEAIANYIARNTAGKTS